MSVRMLAVAAGAGRMGYVFFVGEELYRWEMSRAVPKGLEATSQVLAGWISDLGPDVVVVEQLTERSRKGARVKAINAVLLELASERSILTVAVERPRRFKNKSEEARALTKRFPVLEPYEPRREHFWDNEPQRSVLYDALVLALYVLENPSERLAAALG